jgi:hypothetical protein
VWFYLYEVCEITIVEYLFIVSDSWLTAPKILGLSRAMKNIFFMPWDDCWLLEVQKSSKVELSAPPSQPYPTTLRRGEEPYVHTLINKGQ